MPTYPQVPPDAFEDTTASAQVAEVLNKSWERAGELDNTATQKADEITASIDELMTMLDYTPPTLIPATELTVSAPSALNPPVISPINFNPGSATVNPSQALAKDIIEPTIVIPPSHTSTDVLDIFKTQYGELIDVLAAKFVAFRASYFPDEQNAYAAVEDWLQAAIANPDAGLPATVVQQIWGGDHARITADKQRAQDAVISQFAARRFPLPPDIAASMTMQLEQKAQDELAESSRKVAILSTELQKFNVEKLLGLRQSAMGSTIEYVKALASGPDVASRVVGIGYDAESKFISSVSQFYGARIQAAEAYNKVAQANAAMSTDASKATTQLTFDAHKHTSTLDADVNKANYALEVDASKHNASMTMQESVANMKMKMDTVIANNRQAFDLNVKAADMAFDELLKEKGFEFQRIDMKIKNMQGELQAMAQMATALYNNLHVTAGISSSASSSYNQNWSGELG